MVRAVSKYSLRLQNPSSTGVTPSSSPNHREKDRTIAQTFVSALHLFKTRILRFTIDHLRATRVVDVALWRIASDIPTLARSLGCCHATKRIFPRAAKTHLALGADSNFGTNAKCRADRVERDLGSEEKRRHLLGMSILTRNGHDHGLELHAAAGSGIAMREKEVPICRIREGLSWSVPN
jgi:hypothetical protein